MFLNVFYSWLIAQVFHPILFIASLWLLDGRFFINVEYIFFFLLISILVSLPGLLAGWLCMGLIAYSNYTITAKIFYLAGNHCPPGYLNPLDSYSIF